MWKSKGSSPFATRVALASSRLWMNLVKFAASSPCSAPIDPESSTTNSTSAVEMEDSVTLCEPGWMRQWPTGLKL